MTINSSFRQIVKKSLPIAFLALLFATCSFAQTPTEVIVDNTSAETEGIWTTSTFVANRFGANYFVASGGTGQSKVRWRPDLIEGTYEVFYWLPSGTLGGRSDAAPFTVVHANGSNTFGVDETAANGEWLPLGTFRFNTGTDGYVEASNNIEADFMIADAIRFTPSDDPIDDPELAAPVFSPGAAEYEGSADITITAADGATIRYTIDGTNPTPTSGTIYTGPVSISGSLTLKAIAYQDGFIDSVVTLVDYGPGGNLFYVDPANGSMSNSGDENNPWSTLQDVFEAEKTFRPDDIIYLRSGNHGKPVVTGQPLGFVTIQPEEGESPTLVNLTVTNASRWIISGLTISPETIDTVDSSQIVTINPNCELITIQDCHIYHVSSVDNLTVDNISQHLGTGLNCSAPNSKILNNHIQNTNYSLVINATAVNVLVKNNLIEGIKGDGIRCLANYGIYENNVIRDFYGVDEHHDDAFQSWSGGHSGLPVGTSVVKGIEIRGNTIINQTTTSSPFPDTYGVQGMGFFDGFYEDFVIENNLVIIEVYHGITLLGARNCRVVNNTVVLNPNAATFINPWILIAPHKDTSVSTDNLVRNNLVSTMNTAERDSAVDHNIQIGGDFSSHFVDYQGFDFHLIPSSPAVNAGSSELAPTTDRDGALRDSTPDIGAFELPGDPVIKVFPNAIETAANWYTVAWFGNGPIYTASFPWITHVYFGWVWVGQAKPTAYWLYDLKLGWIYTSPAYSNYYYSSTLHAWLYHSPESGNYGQGRWLYNVSTTTWFTD